VLGRGLKPDRQARGGKQDGGKEVAGGFVVTRGDAEIGSEWMAPDGQYAVHASIAST
jgi:hypothetical protein